MKNLPDVLGAKPSEETNLNTKTGLTVPKFKRVIDRDSGDLIGMICYQFDFDNNKVMAGLTLRGSYDTKDVYDKDEGANIAISRLMRKDASRNAYGRQTYVEVSVNDVLAISSSSVASACKLLAVYVKPTKRAEFTEELMKLVRSNLGPLNIDALDFNDIMGAVYKKFDINTRVYR